MVNEDVIIGGLVTLLAALIGGWMWIGRNVVMRSEFEESKRKFYDALDRMVAKNDRLGERLTDKLDEVTQIIGQHATLVNTTATMLARLQTEFDACQRFHRTKSKDGD